MHGLAQNGKSIKTKVRQSIVKFKDRFQGKPSAHCLKPTLLLGNFQPFNPYTMCLDFG